jgi:hypothetical protein
MRKLFFYSLTIALTCSNCSSQEDPAKKKLFTESITKVEMNLSAFSVESDSFPSIVANIDLVKDSSNCEKTYYNPAFKPSTYRLSSAEIKKVIQLLNASELRKLKTEYKVSKTDQRTSTTKIYFGQRTVVIKDYGLVGDYPLQELYKIVYKY